MATEVGARDSVDAWERTEREPVELAPGQTWIGDGWVERLRSVALRRAAKGAAIGGLLVTAGFCSRLAPYDGVVRFIVAAGALAVVFLAFRARRYTLAVVFGALALLYCPIAPAFVLSTDWRRTTAVAIAVLLVASLADLKKEKDTH
jgi:hypothetical protein